jgi:AcrR family transcriptional regulator
MALQRAEILSAALAVFLRQGYSRASISDIVGELGKAKSWLYTYYPSKEALFLDIVAFKAEEAAAAYGPAPDADVSLADALRIVGLRYLSIVLDKTQVDFYRMTIAEAPHLPAIGEIFHQQVRASIVAPLAARLQSVVEKSGAAFTDYLHAGEFFYDLCASGLHRRALIGVQERFSDEERRANVERAVSVLLSLCAPTSHR